MQGIPVFTTPFMLLQRDAKQMKHAVFYTSPIKLSFSAFEGHAQCMCIQADVSTAPEQHITSLGKLPGMLLIDASVDADLRVEG